MEAFFYIIIFIMGITFGSFYTLAVYRIPKKQDITHTHSYCPNCNHKLGILDLIPVFSYIFLGGKCRYCKQKIRARYLILETISGVFFVLLAYLMKLSIYDINIIKILDFSFFILYFTFIILIAGIDKEKRYIDKKVSVYGIVIAVMYIVYLYIMDTTSIYRYVIYLCCLILLLILDTHHMKKKSKNSYTYMTLIMIIIMTIFTGEYITFNTIITTLLVIAINLLVLKMKNKENKNNNSKLKIGYILSVTNIIYFIFTFLICKFI